MEGWKNGILPAGRQGRQGREKLVLTPSFHYSNIPNL